MSTLLEVQACPVQLVSCQWLKDGEELSDSFRYSGVHNDVLFINLACQGSEGKYWCCVGCGREEGSSTEIEVSVSYSPEKKDLLAKYSMLDAIPKDLLFPTCSEMYLNLAFIKKGKVSEEYDYAIQGDINDVLEDKEKIQYEVEFGEYKRGQRLSVEGRPGIGKTTLVHKITRDWSSTGLILKGAKLVFLISLRVLVSRGQKNVALSDMLEFFYEEEKAEKVAGEIVKAKGDGTCFILDGLDEYQSKEKDSIVDKLLYNGYLSQAMIIVASRPVATAKLKRLGYRRIEVLGFTKDRIWEYISSFPFGAIGSSCEKDVASKLKAYLGNHKNVLRMCYLPVQSGMICSLYKKYGDSMPHTETEIYKRITILTVLRKMKRKGTVDAELESYDEMSEEDTGYLSRISKLAFDMTVASKQTAYHFDVHKSLVGSSKNASLGFLILDATASLLGVKDLYTFYHLTFQEYLAAYHIASLPDTDKQMKVIKSHGKKQHMQVVWKFYSGIVGAEGKGKISHFEEILKCAKTDSLYKVHCAFESQNEGFCSSVVAGGENKALSFKGHIFTPFDFTAIGYVISTSTQPVQKLDFDQCKLGEGSLSLLSEVGEKIKSLSALCFHSRSASDSQFQVLNRFLRELPMLAELDLEKTVLTPKAIDILKKEVELSCLRRLKLHFPLKECEKSEISTCLKKLRLRSGKLEFVSYSIPKSKDVPHEALTLSFGSNLFPHDDVFCANHIPFQSLVRFPNQSHTTIALWNCSIDDTCAERLAEGLTSSSLVERLELNFNMISGTGAKSLAAALQTCSKLREFSALCNQIDDCGALALTKALVHSSNLRVLNLQDNAISKEGGIAVGEVTKVLPMLPKLSLCNANFTEQDAVKVLSSFYSMRSCWKEVVRGGPKAFSSALHCCHDLFELRLYDMDLGPRYAAALGEWLKCSSTTSSDGVAGVSKGPTSIHLHTLDLSRNSIGSGGAASLADGLAFCTNLRTLDVSSSNVGPGGASSLVQGISSCKTLRTLDLCNNNIGPEGCAGMAEGLVSCKNLQIIRLSENSIGPDGAASLAKGLVLCVSLQELSLSENKIGLEGAASLAEALVSCKSLQTLFLSGNNMGAEGAALLLCCKSLQTLCFTRNRIGSEGAASLAEGLVSCEGLRKLYLSGNDIDLPCQVSLREKLRRCTIYF